MVGQSAAAVGPFGAGAQNEVVTPGQFLAEVKLLADRELAVVSLGRGAGAVHRHAHQLPRRGAEEAVEYGHRAAVGGRRLAELARARLRVGVFLSIAEARVRNQTDALEGQVVGGVQVEPVTTVGLLGAAEH